MAESNLMVAAIDFGTTYSGYAFTMRSDTPTDVKKGNKTLPTISAPRWSASDGGLISLKTPTTVLLDSKKELVAFGYSAEEQYAELAEENEHDDYYYFQRFKMLLYDKVRDSKLSLDTKLHDIRNKELPAVEVFTHAIKYLKDHLMDSVKKSGHIINQVDITWVLTVPAIWDDPAKQFMRKAAQAAGIDGKQLMIALEPEAASIYCKEIPVEKNECGDMMDVFKPGSKYLVLDAGGGTIDITVHEVQEDGKLKELDKASGNNWGGTSVDIAFEETIADIVGNDFLERYRQQFTADYLEMFRGFEVKKRKQESSSQITLRIPSSFTEETNNKIEELTKKSKYHGCLKWKQDKVRIDLATFESFFDPACVATVQHVKELLRSPKVTGTNIILMVGGFSESPLLQNAIRESFPFCRVVIPQEAGLAVLKGAVLFGQNPTVISSRIAKFTYGVDMNADFIHGYHKQSKLTMIEGKEYCRDVFHRHVKQGQTLMIDEAQQEQTYVPIRSNQTAMTFNLYTATNEDPVYVDEVCCTHIGNLTIEMPCVSKGMDRKVKVRFIFGGTELEVEATNVQTNEKTRTEIDLLAIGEN